MPNLFPEEFMNQINEQTQEQEVQEQVQFGRSWKFDFEKGDFVQDASGKLVEAEPFEAWVDWCNKALRTTRYKHLIYSADYGQEFEDLLRRHLTREANESEIKRMVTECLMVNPYTDRVENFKFQWTGDEVRFTFDIYNILGEGTTLDGSVVINS